MREYQQQFIEEMYPYAERVAQKYGVSPEVILAQVAQETGWGQKVQEGTNNLFNIKAGSDWEGPTRSMNALEYEGGIEVREPSDFRVYESPAQSFDDYAAVIDKPHFEQARMAGDDRGYVEGLQQGGYATDPNYAENIMRIRDQLMPTDEGYAPVTQEEYASPPAEPETEYFLASDQGMNPWDRMALRFADGKGDLGERESQQGFMGDMVDALQGGMYGSVGSLAELTEQFFGVGGGIRDWAYEGRDSQMDTMSDQSRAAFMKEFFTEDEQGRFAPGDGLTDPRTWALQVADLTGQMASIMVGGGGSINLGFRAIGKLAEKGAVKQLTRKAAAFKAANKGKELPKHLTPAQIKRQGKLVNRVSRNLHMQKYGDALGYGVYGLLGGGVAQGQGASQAREEYLALDKDTLMGTEHFRERMEEQDPNLSEDERFEAARLQGAEDAAYAVATDPTLGSINILTGAIGTKYLDDLLTGSRVARSWYGRMGKGAGIEAGSEGLQEGGAQRAVNLALDDLGVERDEWEGVPQAAATGSVLGAVLGGAGGAVNTKGADPKDPKAKDETPAPDAPPVEPQNAAEAAAQNEETDKKKGKKKGKKPASPTPPPKEEAPQEKAEGELRDDTPDFLGWLNAQGLKDLSPQRMLLAAEQWRNEVEGKTNEAPVSTDRLEQGRASRERQATHRHDRQARQEILNRQQDRADQEKAADIKAKRQARVDQRAADDQQETDWENYDVEGEALKAEAAELKRLEELYRYEIGNAPRKRSSKANMKRIIRRFKENLARRVERGEAHKPEHFQAGEVTNSQLADQIRNIADDFTIADLEAAYADMISERAEANADSQTGFNETNASAAAQTLSSKAKRKQWLKDIKSQRGDVPVPVWAQLNAEMERQIQDDVIANGVGDIPANTMADKLKAALANQGNGTKAPGRKAVKAAVKEAVIPTAPTTPTTPTPTAPKTPQTPKAPKPEPKPPKKPLPKKPKPEQTRKIRGWMMTKEGAPLVKGMDRKAVADKAKELHPDKTDLTKAEFEAVVKAVKETPPEPPKPPKPPKKPQPKKPQKDAEKKPQAQIKQGKVGMKLGSGESVRTSTGMVTSPFPNVPKKVTPATLKKVNAWLLDNARVEAQRRGDQFNGKQFDAMDAKNLSQSDKDHAESYLFDPDFVTEANGNITRPLVKPEPEPAPAPEPEPKAPKKRGRPKKDEGTRVRKKGVPTGFTIRTNPEGQFYIEDPDGDRVNVSGLELFANKDLAEDLLLRESNGKPNWQAWLDGKQEAPAVTGDAKLGRSLLAVAKARHNGSQAAASRAQKHVDSIVLWAKENLDPKDGVLVMRSLLSNNSHEWQTALKMVADRAGIHSKDLHKFFSMENELNAPPTKAMMRGAVETISRHWLNRYKGAAGARVRVVQSQSELSNIPPGKIVRAYWDDGEVVLVADNLTSQKDVEAALRHEILVHHGLKTVLPRAEYRRLIKMIMRTRGQDPKLDKIWEKVKKVYSAYPIEVQAEEVFAAYAEKYGDKGTWAKAWDRVKEFIRLALGRIGLLPRGSSSAELDSALDSIAKGFRSDTVEATVKQAMPFDDNRLYAMKEGTVEVASPGVMTKDEIGAAFKQIGGGIKAAAKAVMDDPKIAAQYFWSLVKDNRRLFLKLVPWSAHNEIAKGMGFTTVQKFTDLIRQMNGYRNELQSVSDKLADHWRSLMFSDRESADKTTDLMYDTTLLAVDPSKDSLVSYIDIEKHKADIKTLEQQILSTPGDARTDLNKKLKEMINELEMEQERIAKWDELKERYRVLPDEFKKLYTDVRDAYAERLKKWHGAQIARVDSIFKADAKKHGQDLAKLERLLTEELATKPEREHKKIKAEYKKNIKKLKDEFFLRDNSAKKALAELELAYNTRSTKGPYFPLSRFGNYFISVKTVEQPHPVTGELMDGDVIYFETYDTDMQRYMAEKEIRKKYGDENKYHIQSNSIMQDNDPAVYLGGRLAANVKLALDDAIEAKGLDPQVAAELKDQVTQFYYKSLPSVSTRKHQMHRKQREGFSRDAVRTFGHYMFHDSYQLARMVYTDRMRDQVDKIADDAKKLDNDMATYIAESAKRRFTWVMEPKGSPFSAKLTSLGFIWYLGLAPAAAITNLFQTPIVALPHLASKYGYTESINALLGALRDLRKGKGHIDGKDSGLTDDERAAFEQWVKEGLIDKTLAMDLAGIAEHGMEYSAVGFKVMQSFSALFHGAERWNREVTALAAYRLKQKEQKGKQQSEKMNRKIASDYAVEAVETSHFVYDSANKAEFLQNDWMKVAFLFRQYGISMAWRMGRDAKQMFAGLSETDRAEAKTRLTGILGMSFLFTGAMGMPLYPVVETLMNALFDDEDEPYSFSLEFRKFLNDFVGNDLGAMLAHGPAQHITGAGMAHRMSLANLFFMDDGRVRDAEDTSKYWLEQFAGPVFGIGRNVARGADLIGDGQVYRGIEYMLPKAFKDVLKAYRYADEGARNLRGNPIHQEFTPAEIFYQAMGYIPTELSEKYERNNYVKNIDTKLSARRSNILNLYALGKRENDPELVLEAKAKAKEWNKAHPEEPINQKHFNQSLGSRADYDKRVRDGIGFANKRLWLFDANNYLN